MWIRMSAEFRQEAERFRLAFTCEGCAHFCPDREACAIQYPTEPHRERQVEALADGERVFFCKMFEPG